MDDVDPEFLYGASTELMDELYDLVTWNKALEESCNEGAIIQLEEAIERRDGDLVTIPVSLLKHLSFQLEKAFRKGYFDHAAKPLDALYLIELEAATTLERKFRLPVRSTGWNPDGLLPESVAGDILTSGVEIMYEGVIPERFRDEARSAGG